MAGVQLHHKQAELKAGLVKGFQLIIAFSLRGGKNDRNKTLGLMAQASSPSYLET